MIIKLKNIIKSLKKDGYVKEKELNNTLKLLITKDEKSLKDYLISKFIGMPKSIRNKYITDEDYKKIIRG